MLMPPRFIVMLSMLLLFVPSLHATSQQETPEINKIIMSSDASMGLIGGWHLHPNDPVDSLGILMALDEPTIDLQGVAIVFGVNYTGNEYMATSHLFRLLDDSENKPVLVAGAEKALEVEQTKLWLLDENVRKVAVDPDKCVNQAVWYMHNDIMKHGNVTLLSTGPLTDIACLFRTFPEVLEEGRVKEVIAMMGREENQSFSLAGVPAVTDFNFLKDPVAAEIVLEQDSVPVRLLTFSVTSSVFVPKSIIPEVKKGDELSEFLYGSMTNWIDYFSSALKLKTEGFYAWDGHVVNYLIDPEAYTCTEMGYKIKECSKEGQCAGHDEKPIRAGSSLAKEAKQLWVSPEYDDTAKHMVCNAFKTGGQSEADYKARILGRF